MTKIIIEHEVLFDLYAKVEFDNVMTEFRKKKLIDNWEKFKKQVDKTIEIVETTV